MAAPVVFQTDTYSFPLSPNDETLTFDQFNIAGGIVVIPKGEKLPKPAAKPMVYNKA